MAVALVTLLLTACADNKPDAVDLIVGSHHIRADDERVNDGRGFNEVNPGAALVWDSWRPGVRYSVGAFENSYEDISVYAYREHDWDVGGGVRIGYGTGISTYPGGRSPSRLAVGDVVPVGGIHVSYGPVHLTLAPFVNDRTKGVLALRIRIPLGEVR